MDKQKLLDWINYGLTRSDVLLEEYREYPDKLSELAGSTALLKLLRNQIELGTFDPQEAQHETTRKD